MFLLAVGSATANKHKNRQTNTPTHPDLLRIPTPPHLPHIGPNPNTDPLLTIIDNKTSIILLTKLTNINSLIFLNFIK